MAKRKCIIVLGASDYGHYATAYFKGVMKGKNGSDSRSRGERDSYMAEHIWRYDYGCGKNQGWGGLASNPNTVFVKLKTENDFKNFKKNTAEEFEFEVEDIRNSKDKNADLKKITAKLK